MYSQIAAAMTMSPMPPYVLERSMPDGDENVGRLVDETAEERSNVSAVHVEGYWEA